MTLSVRARVALVLAGLAAAAPALATDAPTVQTAPTSHLTCVAPTDAPAIQRMLAAAESPMADDAQTIVDAASAVGLDPRAVVAIAAHETLLETYPPSRRIHNPFGLGPHWEFPDERSAILKAVEVLDRYYLAEGRTRAATIGPKWAPVGADNDPNGLNNHWVQGVSSYYRSLGGDPDLPLTLSAQDPVPDCGAAPQQSADPNAPRRVIHWNPARSPVAGMRMAQGGDPTTGRAATPQRFAFPLALRRGEAASFVDPVREGPTCESRRSNCAITITSAPDAPVVAALAGTLVVGTDAEQDSGIGFWIESADGDRLGYSPLLSYVDRLRAGVEVDLGDHLGTGTGTLLVAWERDGARINPHALLTATRRQGPPDA